MHKNLTHDALRAADVSTADTREGLMGLVIARAIAFGHQDCIRRLREQGQLVDHELGAVQRGLVPVQVKARRG